MIITFYSYKGGTGRSMTLANVAWILASNGRRVLVVDWDLEAPGLHRYFHPFLADPELLDSPGVIDLVWDFAEAALGAGADSSWADDLAQVEPYTVSLDYEFPGGGRLDLLPAGRQDPLYSAKVGTFDWNSFYERLGGGGFLDAFKRAVEDRYDYVLIDSRTGLSDTAGICTVHLPSTLVICFTLSTQAVEGARAVAQSVVRQRDDLRVFPVPTRVEDGEPEKLELSRDFAHGRFERFLSHVVDPDRYWDEVEVPYRSFFAYEEILAPFGERARQQNTVLAAVENLTSYLTDGTAIALGTSESEAERRRQLARFERRQPEPGFADRPAADGPRAFIAYEAVPPEHTDQVRELWYQLRRAGVDAILDPSPGRAAAEWASWRPERLAAAETVLVVASPREPAPGAFPGLAAGYEQDPERFLPVVLPGTSPAGLPAFLPPATAPVVLDALTSREAAQILAVLHKRTGLRPSPPTPAPRWENSMPRAADEQLAETLDALAESVYLHCRTEIVRRTGVAPDRLPVRFTTIAAEPPVTDPIQTLASGLLELPAGRLAILGPPGSGKTVAAITLLLELLERRQVAGRTDGQMTPVPVLVPAARWSPDLTFETWLAAELRTGHPALTPGRARWLVENALVIPVFDGMDEIPPEHRPAFAGELDRNRVLPFVVTSPEAEPDEHAERPSRTALVRLEPVDLADALTYLERSHPHGALWREVGARAGADGSLAGALATPWSIRLLGLASDSSTANPLVLIGQSGDDQLSDLLMEQLVTQAYTDETPAKSSEARLRLGVLARFLERERGRDLVWWQVPAIAPRGALALTMFGLLFVPGYFIATAVASGFVSRLPPGLRSPLWPPVFVVLFALVAVATAGRTPHPRGAGRRLPGLGINEVVGPPVIVVSALGTGVWMSAYLHNGKGLATGAVVLAVGAVTEAVSTLVANSLRFRVPEPRLEVRRDAWLAVIGPLVFPLAGGILVGQLIKYSAGNDAGPEAGTCAGIFFAVLALTLSLARSAWTRYAVFCLVMSLGDFPLRLLPLLEDARHRGVLRRVGSAYQFRHAELQEYLAAEAEVRPR